MEGLRDYLHSEVDEARFGRTVFTTTSTSTITTTTYCTYSTASITTCFGFPVIGRRNAELSVGRRGPLLYDGNEYEDGAAFSSPLMEKYLILN